jgi:hypothetical protein
MYYLLRDAYCVLHVTVCITQYALQTTRYKLRIQFGMFHRS